MANIEIAYRYIKCRNIDSRKEGCKCKGSDSLYNGYDIASGDLCDTNYLLGRELISCLEDDREECAVIKQFSTKYYEYDDSVGLKTRNYNIPLSSIDKLVIDGEVYI